MLLEQFRVRINQHRVFMKAGTKRKINEKDIEVYKCFEDKVYKVEDVVLVKLSNGEYRIFIK